MIKNLSFLMRKIEIDKKIITNLKKDKKSIFNEPKKKSLVIIYPQKMINIKDVRSLTRLFKSLKFFIK